MAYNTRNNSRNFNNSNRGNKRPFRKQQEHGYEPVEVPEPAINALPTEGKRRARLMSRMLVAGDVIAQKRKMFPATVAQIENAFKEKAGLFPSKTGTPTEEELAAQMEYNEEKLSFINAELLGLEAE